MSKKGSRDEWKATASGIDAVSAVARLCYVDDSRTSAFVIRRLLEPFGYQIDYFSSAEPAFVAMIQEDYDLLLTDLKVSSTGMDGDDLIRTLRNSGHPKISALPIIVITGASDAQILVDVYDAGANQVMKKPVNANELDGHIRRLLFDVRQTEPRPLKSKPAPREGGRRATDSTVVTLPTARRPQTVAKPAKAIPVLSATPKIPPFVQKTLPGSATPAGHKKPAPQRPVSKQTVVKQQAVVERQVVKKPVIKKPVVKKQVVEKPVVQRQVVKKQAVKKKAVTQRPVEQKLTRPAPVRPQSLVNKQPPVQKQAVVPAASVAPRKKSVKPQEAVIETLAPVEAVAPVITADVVAKPATKQKPKDAVEPAFVTLPVSAADDSLDTMDGAVVIIEPDIEPGFKFDTRSDKRGRDAFIDENILEDLDQYTLEIQERDGFFVRSGIVGFLYSLMELMGMRSLLVRALSLGIVLTLAVAGWNTYFNQGIAVKTTFVESGEIFQSITVPGRVVSKQRVNVSAARSGRMVEIFVKEGGRVTRGQVLAKLDDRELLSRLNRAKANLSSARENIVLAERALKRLRTAHSKGAVARRFVEDAEVDLRAARASAGIIVEEVRSAKLDFDSQKITAAFAGTVTARFAEIGQWVGPSETLFTLVDESQREIEVRVDSADSVAIDAGQVVALSSDAFPGLEWEEAVIRLGTATDNNSNANSVKVYISLGKDAPSLRIGQQVDADIRTAWNPNTLKIPFEALISRDGQTMVAVVSAGRVQMKVVETGIEDFAMAEIKQGLTEGEVIILSKGKSLTNGDRVYSVRESGLDSQ
ncbi:MAG: efflux RND transporter periplasmic adaptor subunit [Ectothiorhodospiraceae bacterium]|nr:efflux RND transporter periplasmic adaptor subunit [Ectothiorhodospiraceae bacterium]